MGGVPNVALLPAPRGRLFECARWLSADGCFQWVDILEATLHRWWPLTGDLETRKIDLPVLPAALEWGDGETLLAGRDVLAVYSWVDDRLRPLCRFDLPDDARLNDGSVSPAGDVWIGSMTEGGAGRSGRLFRVTVDGRVSTQLDGIGISNGIVWAGAGSAYYVDSTRPQVDRLRLDAGGDLASRSTVVELDGPGEPDGLALDADGVLYVAMWDGARLVAIDPADGSTRDVPVGADRPTSLAFGGADRRLGFVTTASSYLGEPTRGCAAGGRVGLLGPAR